MNVKDAIVFVTGAARGLGLAFAEEALARGAAKVYAGVRNPQDFDVPGIVPIKLDVTDPASIAAAVQYCGDTTLLVNNAGIAKLMNGPLDENMIELTAEMLDTNFYGVVRVTQAFAPILARNGGGGVINVLSNATWFSIPIIAAYAVSKSAAWSFTNSLRVSLKAQSTQVLALHVGFLDTDMTKGLDVPKSDPRAVAGGTLDALVEGKEEYLGDQGTESLKQSLSLGGAMYLNPPQP